jgi:ATP-binding cassette subfamily F protein 3
MLLRPSNTLLLDEPTNHLDLDSKDVLLEALEDYGGTLIIVSHDRYFVERLATKIIEIGHGEAVVYPGTYTEFLWHKEKASGTGDRRSAPVDAKPRTPAPPQKRSAQSRPTPTARATTSDPKSPIPDARSRDERKRDEADRRKKQRASESLLKRIADLEGRIAEREAQVKALEAAMATSRFYDDSAAAAAAIDRHKTLMWEVGDLMAQWEALQEHASES